MNGTAAKFEVVEGAKNSSRKPLKIELLVGKPRVFVLC
jgi:hypothetical protein